MMSQCQPQKTMSRKMMKVMAVRRGRKMKLRMSWKKG
jgi:hypothetical protein